MALLRADADRGGDRVRRRHPSRSRGPDHAGHHAALRPPDDAGGGVRLPAGHAGGHQHHRRHHVDPVRYPWRAHLGGDDRRRPRDGQAGGSRAGSRGGDDELARRGRLRRARPRPGHPHRAARGARVRLSRVLHAGGAGDHLRGCPERGGAASGTGGRRSRALAGHDRARSDLRDAAVHLRPALPVGRRRPGADHDRLLRDPGARRDRGPAFEHRAGRRQPGRWGLAGRSRHLSALAPGAPLQRDRHLRLDHPGAGGRDDAVGGLRSRGPELARPLALREGGGRGRPGAGRGEQLDARREPRHHRRVRCAGEREHGRPDGRLLHPGSGARGLPCWCPRRRATWP